MLDEEMEHDFLEDASFDDVIARYNFDRSEPEESVAPTGNHC